MGKNTITYNVLRTIQDIYKIDFYSKMGGLKKFWDGYDNQPIVITDDPRLFNVRINDEDVVAFKSIISSEEYLTEIKFGTMQFIPTSSSC